MYKVKMRAFRWTLDGVEKCMTIDLVHDKTLNELLFFSPTLNFPRVAYMRVA